MFAIKVDFLDLANLLIKSLNFKLISIHLRLVVLELLHHLFQLIGSLFQVLLVYLQFFSNLWSTLFSQDILKFNVELLLLLDKDVFF